MPLALLKAMVALGTDGEAAKENQRNVVSETCFWALTLGPTVLYTTY